MNQITDNQLKEILIESPLVLLSCNNSILKRANEFLPYSTGFEIECDQKETFSLQNFTSIPYIMDVNIDSWEQRFRIPNGVRGLFCLYFISEQLKTNSALNLGSGIHYHIDFSEPTMFEGLRQVSENSRSSLYTEIIHELEKWEYKGSYNSKKIGSGHYWVRLNQQFSTMEIRIGEMTFDYNLLATRIIHANEIAKKIKASLNYHTTLFAPIDKELLKNYYKTSTTSSLKTKSLQKSLEELLSKKQETVTLGEQEMLAVIKKRTRSIY